MLFGQNSKAVPYWVVTDRLVNSLIDIVIATNRHFSASVDFRAKFIQLCFLPPITSRLFSLTQQCLHLIHDSFLANNAAVILLLKINKSSESFKSILSLYILILHFDLLDSEYIFFDL